MIDYKVAFQAGLTAAEEAENARKEIDSVFDKLNSEIAEVSGGKIVIERREFDERETRDMTTRIAEAAALVFNPTSRQQRTYWAIAASNPTITDGPVRELARWSTDKRGYPCKISWGGQEHFCEDKEALEQALAELLRDPIVGEKLYVLTKLEPPTEEETNGSADPES